MERGASWLIGASVLGVLVVCSGLGGALFYVVARRADAEQAAAMEEARRVEVEAREAARHAAEEQERAVRVMSEVERARQEALAAAAEQQALAPGADEPRMAAVRETGRALAPRLRGCYERVLRTEPHASVRGTLSLVYGADGALRSAELVEIQASPAGLATRSLETCVEQAFSGSTIPAGAEDLAVSLPLTFTAS